jgi:formamidopyrimidine-DNA glycosylase
MPQGRPLKRPSDAGDVAADASAPKVKLARLERGPEDFSNVVKTKLQSYTRTGQACDRCKVCWIVI